MRPVEEPQRPDRYRPGFWKPFGIVVAAWFGLGLIVSASTDVVRNHDAGAVAGSVLPLGLFALLVAFGPRWVLRVDPPNETWVTFRTMFRSIPIRLEDIRAVRIGRAGRISVRHTAGRLYLRRRTSGWAEAMEAARRVNPGLEVAARGRAWAITEEALWSLPLGALLGFVFATTHATMTSVMVGGASALFVFGVHMTRWLRERRSAEVLASRRGRIQRRAIRTPRTWWVLPSIVAAVAAIGWAAINWFAGTPPHGGVDTFLALITAGFSTFLFWLAVVLVSRRLSSNGEHPKARAPSPN